MKGGQLCADSLLRLHVHHLFVVDAEHTLIGVISSLDVLRKLWFAEA